MGVSTDALLFYGYCWTEEDSGPEWIEGESVPTVRGIQFVVDTHCSASCPMGYVAVKSSLTVSHRGYPSKIRELTTDPAWDAALAEVCKKLGIKVGNKKPAWWLASDWSE